jgi:hypothetical protein
MMLLDNEVVKLAPLLDTEEPRMRNIRKGKDGQCNTRKQALFHVTDILFSSIALAARYAL